MRAGAGPHFEKSPRDCTIEPSYLIRPCSLLGSGNLGIASRPGVGGRMTFCQWCQRCQYVSNVSLEPGRQGNKPGVDVS